MRSMTVVAVIGAAALLGACGKSGTTDTSASAPSSSTPAAPAAGAPTPEQVKTLLAELPAPYNAGDIENGQTKFAVCASCHTLTDGGSDMTGPNLHGVFTRKGGSKAGYKYSDAMVAAGPAWDAATLDKWIENPRAMIPGTKMSFIGLKDPKDRADLVAYLKVATSDAPK